MATLYIVATPIGNLEDMTFRAVSTLKSVDLILCEDTRTSKKLLDIYGISTPTKSYHAQSTEGKTEYILDLLGEGKNIALISDAGTPGISDPGSALIAEVKARFGTDVVLVPIPGASAAITALSASGLPTAEFTFLGFLPHKKGRQTLFQEIADSSRTILFYESPHRIMKTLESLQLLSRDRKIVIARELTKIFEQFVSGNPQEVLKYFVENPDKVRGEFTVLVSPK